MVALRVLVRQAAVQAEMAEATGSAAQAAVLAVLAVPAVLAGQAVAGCAAATFRKCLNVFLKFLYPT